MSGGWVELSCLVGEGVYKAHYYYVGGKRVENVCIQMLNSRGPRSTVEGVTRQFKKVAPGLPCCDAAVSLDDDTQILLSAARMQRS